MLPVINSSTVVRAAVLYLLGAAFGGAVGVIATSKYYDSAIDKQKLEAASLLVTETNKVIAAERDKRKLSDELESKHNEAASKIAEQHSANVRLASELERLREQRRRESSNGTVSRTGSTATCASEGTDGAGISGETALFLADLTYDADEVANYARTCYEWINKRKEKP